MRETPTIPFMTLESTGHSIWDSEGAVLWEERRTVSQPRELEQRGRQSREASWSRWHWTASGRMSRTRKRGGGKQSPRWRGQKYTQKMSCGAAVGDELREGLGLARWERQGTPSRPLTHPAFPQTSPCLSLGLDSNRHAPVSEAVSGSQSRRWKRADWRQMGSQMRGGGWMSGPGNRGTVLPSLRVAARGPQPPPQPWPPQETRNTGPDAQITDTSCVSMANFPPWMQLLGRVRKRRTINHFVPTMYILCFLFSLQPTFHFRSLFPF